MQINLNSVIGKIQDFTTSALNGKKIKENISNLAASLKKLDPKVKSLSKKFSYKERNIGTRTKNYIYKKPSNAIKQFFSKSPTIKEACQQFGISDDDFIALSRSQKEDVFKIILNPLNENELSIEDKIKLSEKLLEKLSNVGADALINGIKSNLNDLKTKLEQQQKEVRDAKNTFEKLKKRFQGQNAEEIGKTVDELIEKNKGKINLKLFNTLKKTLKKQFGVSDAEFYKAWSTAISLTRGGEIIGGNISLKFGKKDVNLSLQFTPQNQLSGFIGDTIGLQHYSSAIQNYSLQKTGEKGNHAVNLWKQDITVGVKNMQFLRHGCTRGGEEASKEILLNAIMLQHDINEINQWSDGDAPLKLKFTNVQLMTLGHIADRKMPKEQMETFNKLFEQQPIELKTKDGTTIKIKVEQPLLFDFGVNLQHFRGFEKVLADKSDKTMLKEQNLKSFKQLFGEDFPQLTKSNGKIDFGKTSLIGKKLTQNISENEKNQIQTLANQILTIYQTHPEGLKENPYALPTRVLALTNLLGYASSFNCKSGKDRTGLCAMELSNLCAQMMTGNDITDPMKPITKEEKTNLHAIYAEGSSARDILKINTVFQENLNIQEYLNFDINSKRFDVDWKKSFEENIHPQKKDA